MRQLWTNELITYEGRWHKITDAGILPLPVQRPIPVWLGGAADRTVRRIVSIGDGWILTGRPDDRAKGLIDKLNSYADEAGREMSSIGLEGWVSASIGGPDDWAKEAEGWKALGATHVSLNTMRADLADPAAHIDAIRQFKEATNRHLARSTRSPFPLWGKVRMGVNDSDNNHRLACAPLSFTHQNPSILAYSQEECSCELIEAGDHRYPAIFASTHQDPKGAS